MLIWVLLYKNLFKNSTFILLMCQNYLKQNTHTMTISKNIIMNIICGYTISIEKYYQQLIVCQKRREIWWEGAISPSISPSNYQKRQLRGKRKPQWIKITQSRPGEGWTGRDQVWASFLQVKLEELTFVWQINKCRENWNTYMQVAEA